MKKISLIVSVYNEKEGLESFYEKADSACRGLRELGYDYELLFVDDGSQDGSREILRELSGRDRGHVRSLSFSRNFGHEAAMTAGLDYASGELLVFMDADLQHPPSCLPEIVRCYTEGYEVISMVRSSNPSAGLLKNWSSGAFYWLLNRVSDLHFEPNASDFFAISRRVQAVLRKNYREKIRFLRGYVQNVGFRKTTLRYDAAVRVAGKSHYSLRKLFIFSRNTIMCFSNLPLRLGIFAGLCSGLLGLLVLIYTLFTRKGAPSGYATIVVLICFMFAVLFFIVGIIGEYIAVFFEEMKDRPIYIIEDKENFPES